MYKAPSAFGAFTINTDFNEGEIAMSHVTEIFGSKVFNASVMKERLPEEIYELMQRAIKNNKRLDIEVANVVANSMKDWAIENGATHYTHWFQPMTGVTAEKHDSFISPSGDSEVIMEFSGKELVQGESDASSFPSGGLRATFEARGYTAWDPTSYAFIKDRTLCIPTAFCSYGGEALDQKTPLLRSMEAIDKQAVRILKLFGHENVTSVKTTVGPEQEYFLVEKDAYDMRPDLIFAGRTLFGAKPPKGQELDDHYYGSIKPRIMNFMHDLDDELWKLGILAKTEHNEAAPAQHELAPIYTTTNIAADHNQLTMEMLQKVAQRHGLVCLLHEKPFKGVNGSGKHNNWSISTNTGKNLLDPGATPHENAQFLLFLCSVIKAVDDYQELLRASVASAGNDHRLGAHEAPPAVVSMFLGEELSEILEAIEEEREYGGREKTQIKIGVHVIPKFPKDTTDRNRTSPFAFTGNKFEFRMLGSAASISDVNVVLNTAVAESLRQFADILEGASDFETALHDLIKETIKKHKRIIFNGNGYDDKWIEEAEGRGLLNLKTTPDALPYITDKKSVELFEGHKVYSEVELKSRLAVLLENYIKVLKIEARTMLEMSRKDIMPAVSQFIGAVSETLNAKRAAVKNVSCVYEAGIIEKASELLEVMYKKTDELELSLGSAKKIADTQEKANYFRSTVIPLMEELRVAADELEVICDRTIWPYPDYTEMLFGVK